MTTGESGLIIIGIAGFVLFFINDINDWKLKRKWMKISFFLGAVLLVAATLCMCIWGDGYAVNNLAVRIALWILIIPLIAAEIYSLFFSFDPGETYCRVNRENLRQTYTRKFYALCRHPGVLFFILIYMCLWLVSGMTAAGAAVMSGLNVLLALFEDIFVFPACFYGYDKYKTCTPFLIPNRKSICVCIGDFRK